MSLSHEAANSLMPSALVKEVNHFFNKRRSDKKLISYVEKHGEDAFSDRQIPEIVEVEEDENFTIISQGSCHLTLLGVQRN